jgi:tetratricopeptide (TPR) repeat protein
LKGLKLRCFFALLSLVLLGLAACKSEILRQQEETIRLQREEIARQRREIQETVAARQREEQKLRDCNRAFRDYFEPALNQTDPENAIVLYREGLQVCPEDDVAHYELGKLLREAGRTEEARREFEAALMLNPEFADVKRQLEELPQGKGWREGTVEQ